MARNRLKYGRRKLTEARDVYQIDITKVTESSFEEARRSLLNLYHSYVQNHAGYLITVGIGLSVVISSFASFYKNIVSLVLFWVIIVLLVLASLYLFLRLKYWTTCTSLIIGISKEGAIKAFNAFQTDKNNKDPYLFDETPPYLVVLQRAMTITLIDLAHKPADKKFSSRIDKVLFKCALKSAGLVI
jgi:hypothetical protein